MEIMFKDILNLSDDEIKNSKLELNDEIKGKDDGGKYEDKWLMLSDSDRSEGVCPGCSYWGWYGDKHSFYPGNLVFSFIRLYDDEWLFVSAAKALDVPHNEPSVVEIIERFKPYYGRLVVRFKRRRGSMGFSFNLSTYIDEMDVVEVLPCLYTGDVFQGYDNVHLPFGKLEDMFDRKILPTYYEALSACSGIYCLTDMNNGQLYIGSATGEGGVAQRWRNYLDSKHGGNKKLRRLHKECGNEYFERYFYFTLIETFSLSYDRDKILERESYWKDCLDTRDHGYNDN